MGSPTPTLATRKKVDIGRRSGISASVPAMNHGRDLTYDWRSGEPRRHRPARGHHLSLTSRWTCCATASLAAMVGVQTALDVPLRRFRLSLGARKVDIPISLYNTERYRPNYKTRPHWALHSSSNRHLSGTSEVFGTVIFWLSPQQGPSTGAALFRSKSHTRSRGTGGNACATSAFICAPFNDATIILGGRPLLKREQRRTPRFNHSPSSPSPSSSKQKT